MKDLFSDAAGNAPETLLAAWSRVQDRLAEEINTAWKDRFIRPLQPLEFTEGVLKIGAPGKFVYEWVRERHIADIKIAFEDELGEEVRLELVPMSRQNPATAELGMATVTAAAPPRSRFEPNPRFSFDRLVVGQSNRLAVAGAKAVGSSPGDKYNPLFIYGPSGLGKTHMLHAIAIELKRNRPDLLVEYISAQQFAEDFVNALQGNRIEQFRRSQRTAGVWLVDDIQFIAGKDKTQEEVFHTFNTLQQFGKQIVLTADRPPRDLYSMDDRLRSRFEAGLVADVQMPDTETRCAIIQSKADQDQIAISHEVAMFLAQTVPGNIRVLEGALTRIAAFASLENIPLDIDLASDMVDKYYQASLTKPGFTQILEAVSKHYGIPSPDIKGTSRKAPIALARHVAVYMTRRITGDSWNHIGSLFGDRDHTSMMHGYQKIDELMQKDKDFRATITMLIRNVYPEG